VPSARRRGARRGAGRDRWARRLARELIRRNEAHLQPAVQRFLAAVMDGQATGSDLHEDYHHLIYQARRALGTTSRHRSSTCSPGALRKLATCAATGRRSCRRLRAAPAAVKDCPATGARAGAGRGRRCTASARRHCCPCCRIWSASCRPRRTPSAWRRPAWSAACSARPAATWTRSAPACSPSLCAASATSGRARGARLPRPPVAVGCSAGSPGLQVALLARIGVSVRLVTE